MAPHQIWLKDPEYRNPAAMKGQNHHSARVLPWRPANGSSVPPTCKQYEVEMCQKYAKRHCTRTGAPFEVA
eukprot:5287657-Prorocentrum_lima.AAC.1